MENLKNISRNKSLYSTPCLGDAINKWARWATMHGYNIAIFKNPNETPILFIDKNPLSLVNTPIETLKKGFLFANYEGNLYHLDAIYQVNLDTPNAIDLPSDINNPKEKWSFYTKGKPQPTTSKEVYTATVQKGIDTILATNLIKVVPSKIKLQNLPEDFSLVDTFVSLCSKHPSAFISIISTKEFGTWLTATPELLININKKGVFETMSLAGTQQYNPNIAIHEVAWVDKDIEEQAMVSRYIVNRFKELRLREFIEKGPMTIRASNLVHLCTTFTVDTKSTNFKNLGGIMLNLLHPTSAVCGMPKEYASKFITTFEAHHRNFYSGYLGVVNFNGTTSLYVNIRCMELFEGKANLFSGAGVTSISTPEKEWYETELKFDTLLNTIR